MGALPVQNASHRPSGERVDRPKAETGEGRQAHGIVSYLPFSPQGRRWPKAG